MQGGRCGVDSPRMRFRRGARLQLTVALMGDPANAVAPSPPFFQTEWHKPYREGQKIQLEAREETLGVELNECRDEGIGRNNASTM